jgi:cell division protein FtsA
VERVIAAIDVGSTKVCTLIGRVGETGDALHVVGMGVAPARGVHRGVVTDIDLAARCIGESVQRAQRMAGLTLSEAYVSVGGSHIASQKGHGPVSIGHADRLVDRDDITRVIEAAEAIALPHNRRILHTIPREYIIDGQRGIRNPLGMMGYRLEVETHIVTAADTALQNLRRCVEMNQIDVLDLVLQPLASAEAVLTDEERNMGVMLADIGGGTTDVAVYTRGSVWSTSVYPLGGYHITNDIGMLLHTPFAAAEDAKIRYATATPWEMDDSEVIEIAIFGEEHSHKIARRELCEIVYARVDEILETILQDIRRTGLESLLAAGVVLTGGSASLRGLRQVAEQKLGLPVRVGAPHRLHGLVEAISSPAYATSVGLLIWGQKEQAQESEISGPALSWQKRLGNWAKAAFIPRR